VRGKTAEAKPGQGRPIEPVAPIAPGDQLPFYVNTCTFGGYALTEPKRKFTRAGTEYAYVPLLQYSSGQRRKDGRRPHQIITVQAYQPTAIERLMEIKKGEAFIAIGRLVVPYGFGIQLVGGDSVQLIAHYINSVKAKDVEPRKWVSYGGKRN